MTYYSVLWSAAWSTCAQHCLSITNAILAEVERKTEDRRFLITLFYLIFCFNCDKHYKTLTINGTVVFATRVTHQSDLSTLWTNSMTHTQSHQYLIDDYKGGSQWVIPFNIKYIDFTVTIRLSVIEQAILVKAIATPVFRVCGITANVPIPGNIQRPYTLPTSIWRGLCFLGAVWIPHYPQAGVTLRI